MGRKSINGLKFDRRNVRSAITNGMPHFQLNTKDVNTIADSVMTLYKRCHPRPARVKQKLYCERCRSQTDARCGLSDCEAQ